MTGNSLFMTQHAYAWYKLIYQKPPAKQNQMYWRSYFFDYPSGSKVTAKLPPQSHFCRRATMVKLVKLSFLLFKPVKFPLKYSKATSKVRIKIFQFIYQDLKASVFFFCWIFNNDVFCFIAITINFYKIIFIKVARTFDNALFGSVSNNWY